MLVEGIAAVTVLFAQPLAEISRLDTQYYPTQMQGLACERPEDLKVALELWASMPDKTPLYAALDEGRKQKLRCDHYDTIMYDVGAVAKEAGGVFEANGKTYFVRHLLFGTNSYHKHMYVARSQP
ncbi:MAG: hypothetical protein KBD50_00060 [Candidatus Pacebacteria bacterium]|nr:hypothetical protein [Candidatus Paceibacterota bacterium]